MSDNADLDPIPAMIEHRLATLFRELCRRELLGDEEAGALVGQATHPPAAAFLREDAPTPRLRSVTMRRGLPEARS